MAIVGLFDDDEEQRRQAQLASEPAPSAPAPTAPPPTLANPFNSSAPAATDQAQAAMIERDKGSWEQRLREEAQKAGVGYDPSDLQGVVNFTSYASNAGKDPMEAIQNAIANYAQRASNNRGPDTNDPRVATSQPSGQTSSQQPSAPSYQAQGVPHPGTQFNDPYTNYLEQIAKQQIESLTSQNAQTQQLMDFLQKQFSELSASPGYSPEEMAVLNTQALEPIEQMRNASRRRELERTGARGFLPSSGLHAEAERGIDSDYDRMRTAANRDLAINAINQQRQKRQQALQIGTQLVQFPQQQRTQALDVANLLYQLPRQAMMDANTIVSGSAPQNMVSPYIQLLQQQQQQQYLQQQQQQAYYSQIGQLLGGLFD